MADTYTQLNIHLVFAVKGRSSLLTSNFRYRLFEYLGGFLKRHGQYPLAINGYTDHIHLFLELNPTTSIADIVRLIKSSSSKWINENKFIIGKFSWQEGYGAFSYSRSQRKNVIHYIENQETHHKTKTFKEEYLSFLENFGIDYNEKYLFEWME